MADWTASAGHTYEFWRVNPTTWRDVEPVKNVLSCSITRDDSDLMGSVDMEIDSDIEQEIYIRAYLIVEQPPGSGITERFCLSTFLVQSPTRAMNGKRTTRSLTCYPPTIELQDTKPPIGFTVAKGMNIASIAAQLCRSHCRAPIIETSSSAVTSDPVIASDDDSWLTFIKAVLEKGDLEFAIDEWGRFSFPPKREASALRALWTYTDDNSSVLLPEVTDERDWFGIPNVYEAVMSSNDSSVTGRAVNDSPSSPISTVNRGREVYERETSPDIGKENPTAEDLSNYARNKLKELSKVERSVDYSHGYNSVKVGDTVEVNYTRHGYTAKGVVTSQVINCDTACTVEETVKFTEDLWR